MLVGGLGVAPPPPWLGSNEVAPRSGGASSLGRISAKSRRATKEGKGVLRTPLHVRTLVFLRSAWLYELGVSFYDPFPPYAIASLGVAWDPVSAAALGCAHHFFPALRPIPPLTLWISEG